MDEASIRKSKHKKFKKEKAENRSKKQEESKWLLPSVNSRFKNEESKRHKHTKKHKKHKHKSKSAKIESSGSQSFSSSDSSSQEDSGTEWVEAEERKSKTSPKPEVKVQRDGWMIMPDFGPTFSKSKSDKQDAKDNEEVKQSGFLKPGQHERELNPFWRDGGTGLPSVSQNKTNDDSNVRVGDGGLNWLQRAYQRAVEQAEEQGRSLEEVVAERWGSLEKLQKLMHASADRAKRSNQSSDSKRREHRDYRDRDAHKKRPHKHSSKDPSEAFFKPVNEGEDEPQRKSELYSVVDRSSPIGKKVPGWKKQTSTQPSIDLKETTAKEPTNDVQVESSAAIVASVPKQPKTDDEMNKIAAQILKAEIMGDELLAKKLKKELEDARHLREFGAKVKKEDKNSDDIILLTTNQKGLSKPFTLNIQEDPYGGGRAKKKKAKVDCYDTHGARTHYFTDDNKLSLHQMFEKEKSTTAEEQNAMFSHLAKSKGFKQTDDFDVDDLFVNEASQREVTNSQFELEKTKRLNLKTNEAIQKCWYCFGNSKLQKHLIVAIATKVYLRLPHHCSLTAGHCQIIPMHHELASTHLDEDVWDEVEVFKKTLANMFESMNQDVVFFETSMNRKHYPHMIIDCVPLAKDVGNLAPMYFKKAIMECEHEWSNNKKLVVLGQKKLRNSVPKELPYFCVNFGSDGDGFAHVIEDEQAFPSKFAQEIIAGMLELDPETWRKPRKESFELQREKVIKFSSYWGPYDWTQDI